MDDPPEQRSAPPDRRSERELFDDLLELDAPSRVEALARIGHGDPALRERLVRLLEAESESAESPRFLSRAFIAAVGEVGAERSPFGPLPRPLGHFRLLSVLGSGGMGVVFEAEQQRPRRRVALKVMRSDLTSPSAMQRFRREIETLGRLQHPGIAQIHEAGSLESRDGAGDSLPYIAMQLVRGEPLDEFARARRLGPRHAAELLVAVCDAAHHAHQRGVVHRDLKPANILVVSDGNAPPSPTVLDFGIARLTERAGPTGTIATSAGQILGTLAYMSPEQLAGNPSAIDHRTDIYSLGVILYELLAGRLPLDVRDRPIADAVRVVRDEEPTRLGTIDHALRGDLETIVSKAIEKDAARRYPSAQALGDELRRYLRDEPILARPTTRIERMRRFARRHRAVVVGAAGTFLALSIGTIATAIFASRAMRARDDAEWLAYRSNVAAASAAFAIHDVASTRRFLDDAPVRFRGWEWRYLDANLDRSASEADLKGPLLPPRGMILSRSGVATMLARSAVPAPDGWLPSSADASPPGPGAALLDLQRGSGRTLWRVAPDTLLLRGADRALRIALPRTDAEVAAGISAVHAAIAPDGAAIAVLVGAGHSAPMRVWYRRLDGAVDASLEAANGGRHLALDVGVDDLVAINGGPERLPVLWKPREGAVIPLRGHVGDVNAVAIDPTGALVATGGADRSLHLYDTATGALASSAREHLDQVTCLAFAPDGEGIATGSLDHTVRVWSAATLGSPMVLNGHRGALQAIEWADTSWLVSYDDTRSIRRWPSDPDAAVGELLVHESNWGRVQFSQRSSHLFGMTNTWTIRRWDLGACVTGRHPR